MYTYNGRRNQLRMTFNRSGRTSFSIKPIGDGDPCKPVSLSNDELRALRDRITTRLGDAPVAQGAPSPVDPAAAATAISATLTEHRDRMRAAADALQTARDNADDLLSQYNDAADSLDSAIDALS